ncbi:MAG: redoxin domain-containing protein [Acidobacteria bacterium]|nr:redoxin domain-containing protein [Acidobacteriota bacterium]
MTIGLILNAFAFAAASGNVALHYPKITQNRASLRPRREQAIMVLALLLVGAGFFFHPGIVGSALGILAIIPASLFLLGSTTSSLDFQWPTVAIGDVAPDFTAPDSAGRLVRLSSLRGSPVLLKFYRGVWCPYCVGELRQLDRYAQDFAAIGVKLVAVSSDRIDEIKAFERKNAWAITLLADPELIAHRLYNVQQRNFAPKRGPFRELAVPTTLLLDQEGRVLWFEQSSDFRVRPQADALLGKARVLLGTDEASAACEVCAA